MAKRPELKYPMPVPEIRSKEEIDTVDAMLTLQYGGNHIRTILQNMVKKRRGNGTRRFYTNAWPDSETYGDLGIDEYSNPYIVFGDSKSTFPVVETVVRGKVKRVRSAVPTITPNPVGIMRFDYDGLYIETLGKGTDWASRDFMSNIINNYTYYDGGRYGMFVYNGQSASSPNIHKPFGGAITKIEEAVCNDSKCVECQPIRPLVKTLKQFNTTLKQKKIPTSGTPARIQSFAGGYKLDYNTRPDNIAYIVELNMKRIKQANAK